jgi:signal transduction histidine kinase
VTLPVPETAPDPARLASRRAEDALVAADRWTLWRTLARGLGHGLANASQMLALDPTPARAREEAIERVNMAIQRLADAHRPPPQGPVVTAEAIEDVQAAQRLQSGFPSTELVLDVAPGLPAVAMPAADLAHVLLALVTNAKQAAGGSRATIAVRAREHAGGVAIEVEDGGPGLAPGHEERAFEPFTGGDATRLGLGLHVARLLCRRAGGGLAVGARPACLRLTLPAWRRAT